VGHPFSQGAVYDITFENVPAAHDYRFPGGNQRGASCWHR